MIAHLADKGILLRSGTFVDATIIDAPASTAKLRDSQVRDERLPGEATSVRADKGADKGHVSAARLAAVTGPGKVWGVMRKAPKGGETHPIDEWINRINRINRIIAMVRAKVEHRFGVIKRPFGHVKTRYRGLARNRAQLCTLFALGTLFGVRWRSMA